MLVIPLLSLMLLVAWSSVNTVRRTLRFSDSAVVSQTHGVMKCAMEILVLNIRHFRTLRLPRRQMDDVRSAL